MRQKKKIFLLIIVVIICSVCYLLPRDSLLSRNMDAFDFGRPCLSSHPVLAKKPKHTNVAFLKTHKTAGSTMLNLFIRFAKRHNLTVALPIKSWNTSFCYPNSFNTRFVDPLTIPPNIIATHMRFNRKEVQRLMHSDTIYITLMREPSSMFESRFYYYLNYCHSFKRVPNCSLEAFLADPLRYYQPNETFSMYARNNVVFDLGKDKDHPATDTAYVQAMLAEVEEIFSLVMITEYFDESLVVLRHLLSWDLDDILYLKLNVRKENPQKLSPDLVSKIRAWNSLESHLYDYFNASLWRKIVALGPAFVAEEVRALRLAQEKLMRRCFKLQTPILTLRDGAYNAKRVDCPTLQEPIMSMKYKIPVKVSHGWSGEDQELCSNFLRPGKDFKHLLLKRVLGSQSLISHH